MPTEQWFVASPALPRIYPRALNPRKGTIVEKKKLDADRAILVPADEGAVEIGVAAAPDPRLLQAVLTVTTADWGQFVIPLSANHVGLLVAWGKTFLNLTPEQVANLRDELNTPERNEDE